MSKNTPDTDVIAGRNPVREALENRGGEIEKVMLQKGATGQAAHDIRRLAKDAGVQVQYVPAVKLDQAAPGVNHQGVVALASPLAYVEVDEMLTAIAPSVGAVRDRKPTILVLDHLNDVYNFGAILRSAVAAGAAGVIVPGRDMAPLNATALKASAGTAARIPVARAKSLPDVLYQLKERGYWVAGATGHEGTSMWEMDWDRPLALVIGSEGKGMRRTIAEACDYRVAIPMAADAESLNASVAAGILLFVAARTRLSS